MYNSYVHYTFWFSPKPAGRGRFQLKRAPLSHLPYSVHRCAWAALSGNLFTVFWSHHAAGWQTQKRWHADLQVYPQPINRRGTQHTAQQRIPAPFLLLHPSTLYLSVSLSLYNLSNKNFSLLSLMPSVSSCPCQIVDGHLINNKQGKNSLSKVKKKKEDLERRKRALHRKSIFLHNIKPRSIRLDADVLDEWSCGIRPTVSSTKNATISQQWYTEPWENVSQRGEISKRLTE